MQTSPDDLDEDDLGAIIEYLRAHVRDHPGDGDALAALASALLGRAENSAGAGDAHGAHEDLDEAIGWARSGLAVVPPDNTELARDLSMTAGIARQHRFAGWLQSGDEDAVGLYRARSDWATAVTLIGGVLDAVSREEPDGPGWITEIEPFSAFLALGDALDPPGPEDQDAFVTWARWLFDDAPSRSSRRLPICDEWDLRTRLALELYERAESGAPDRDCAIAAGIAHLEAALPLTPADDAGQLAAVLVPLTLGCGELLRADDTQYALVDRIVSYGRRAWDLLDADDENRPGVGLLLAAGLHEQATRPNAPPTAPETVDLVITVLSESEPRLAGDARAHLTAEALLGTSLVSRAQDTGSMDDLAAAAPFLLHAVRELPANDPQWLDLTSHLATALTGLAHTGMLASHFDAAIGLLRVAASRVADPERGAQLRASLGITLVTRSFNQRGADAGEGLAHLRAAHEAAPTGSATRIWIAQNLGAMLIGQFFLTGDRQHLQAARFYLDTSEQAYRGLATRAAAGPTPSVHAADIPYLDSTLAANSGRIAMAQALDGDAAAAGRAVEALEKALGLRPAWHPHTAIVLSDLGLARLLLAMSEKSARRAVAMAWAAVEELEAAARALPKGHLMSTVSRLRAGTGLALCGLRAGDLKAIHAGVGSLIRLHGELVPGTEVLIRCTAMLGLLHAEQYRLTSVAADREAALGWLGRAAAEFEREPGHPQHALLLTRIARLHRAGPDGQAAVRAGLAALRVRVRDVLLQTGTAHGLAAARIAAADAAEIVGWCLDDNNPGQAVEALELGRGLVLHAATAVITLPDLLAAAGHGDLAREWRDQVRTAHGEMPWEGDGDRGYFASLLAGAALQAPSDLRKRTLTALADSALADLLSPPGSRQIADALRRTSADALAYLLPPGGGRPGRALVVPADGSGPREIALPALTGAPPELSEYLAAQAEWFAGSAADPTRWRSALAALCEWAWPAVIERVLRAVPGDLPRIVLVPSGQLSLVPWHAARHRREPAGGWRYAVAAAVFSYAASGRQLTEVARRPVLPLPASPVIVAPASSLDPDKLEARALADRVYPGARYLGPGDTAAGQGTPEEVLAALPSAAGPGASMLHLACHASADDAPGRSHFSLAGEAVLTVEKILRQASGRPSRAAGGLVDLVACESDLAAAHYDEAVTLATAFLAGGACTVVGARWPIRVEQSSTLAFMFHHFLVRDGLSPRDALRQAQLWMLDTHRCVPDEMPRPLADRARRTGTLAEPAFWAAITHQGRLPG